MSEKEATKEKKTKKSTKAKGDGEKKKRKTRKSGAAASKNPSYKKMIIEAIVHNGNKKTARSIIATYIEDNYQVGPNFKKFMKDALDEGVKNGFFVQDKQSFSLDENKLPRQVKRSEKQAERKSERIQAIESGIEPAGPVRYQDPEESGRKRKRTGTSPKKAAPKKTKTEKKKAAPKKKSPKKKAAKKEEKEEKEEKHEEEGEGEGEGEEEN